MKNLINALLNDEAGFIVSAELVLVATIAVLALIVGLSEVALNINNELEDVGSAFSCLDQSFKSGRFDGHKGWTYGSQFHDKLDFCAGEYDIK